MEQIKCPTVLVSKPQKDKVVLHGSKNEETIAAQIALEQGKIIGWRVSDTVPEYLEHILWCTYDNAGPGVRSVVHNVVSETLAQRSEWKDCRTGILYPLKLWGFSWQNLAKANSNIAFLVSITAFIQHTGSEALAVKTVNTYMEKQMSGRKLA